MALLTQILIICVATGFTLAAGGDRGTRKLSPKDLEQTLLYQDWDNIKSRFDALRSNYALNKDSKGYFVLTVPPSKSSSTSTSSEYVLVPYMLFYNYLITNPEIAARPYSYTGPLLTKQKEDSKINKLEALVTKNNVFKITMNGHNDEEFTVYPSDNYVVDRSKTPITPMQHFVMVPASVFYNKNYSY